MRNVFTLFFVLLCGITAAQTPQIVGGDDPSQPVEFKGKLYFMGWDNVHGRELWSYDGAAKPSLVYDLNPGLGWGTISGTSDQSMVVYKNKLYFPGDNGKTGPELFAYDGVNPPALTGEIIPGDDGCTVLEGLTVYGSKLYFSASSPANGAELYVYDGAGAPKLIDVNPGVGGSAPMDITPFRGRLYFCGYWPGAGHELLAYDTATLKASMIQDINGTFACGDPVGSAVHSLQVINNKLYFCAYVDLGSELYEYDGNKITCLTDIAPGPLDGISPLGAVLAVVRYMNGDFYISGSATGNNFQLYKYSPATKKTSLVSTINPTGPADPFGYTYYNGKLYFSASGTMNNSELWATNGTTTSLVADIHPTLGSNPTHFYVWKGQLYFRANHASGRPLYRLSTPAVVRQVSMPGSVRLYPNPAGQTAHLELTPDRELAMGIRVTDVTGRAVWTKQADVYPAAKTVVDIPLSGLSSGSYWYQVLDAQGQKLAGGCIVRE